jgi:hypothetical protein
MEIGTWIDVLALSISTGTILGGVSAFFRNFKKEQDEKYMKLEERIFQLATGKTLAQALKEEMEKDKK